MLSNMRDSKSNSQRPGSSIRRKDCENSSFDYSEIKSKIPRRPRRTCSFEGKVTAGNSRMLGTKKRTSAISMIPRPGIKSQNAVNRIASKENDKENTKQPAKTKGEETSESEKLSVIPPREQSVFSLEDKVREDFNNFKNGVLKIPEYWTDAGETVTSILRNAIKIITKQYPSPDVHLFEQDIQKVLKDTEIVKQQILSRIENIINKADNLYDEKIDQNTGEDEQELKMITKRMENLKNEVNIRKNVFGDLLKYGSEMKELLEIENLLKQKALQKKDGNHHLELNKFNGLKQNSKYLEKARIKLESLKGSNKKLVKSISKSCGDSEEQETKKSLETDRKTTVEEKTTQTLHSWTTDLNTREKDLKVLTEQIMEVHKLCKENILKFKNINFQIKMKGYSNKSSRGEVIYRDLQTVRGEEDNGEKTNEFSPSRNVIDVVTNDKNCDIQQKDKLLNQQKKLIQVRNELLGMLKNRCNAEEGIRS